MTDRDALRERLDAVEEDLDGLSPGKNAFYIVYDTDAGIVTPDGDPVPRDANGDLNPPEADEGQLVVVLSGVMAPDAAKPPNAGCDS